MKVGDLVTNKKKKDQEVDHRREWGYGYVIKVHRTMYENHVPFVSVYWPTWNKTTKGSQAYLEVLSEN